MAGGGEYHPPHNLIRVKGGGVGVGVALVVIKSVVNKVE